MLNRQSTALPSELLPLYQHITAALRWHQASGRFSVQWVVANAQIYNWSKYREQMADAHPQTSHCIKAPPPPALREHCGRGAEKPTKSQVREGQSKPGFWGTQNQHALAHSSSACLDNIFTRSSQSAFYHGAGRGGVQSLYP